MNEALEVNLAGKIRAVHAEAQTKAEEAKTYASQAVAKAVECGQLLIQQKEALGHGRWLDWQAENLPEISHDTVSRYMRVAKAATKALPAAQGTDYSNFAPVRNLDDTPTLKQAYMALGLLPAPEKKQVSVDPNKPWVRFTRYLDGFRLWFNKRMDEDPLSTWPEDSRRILKNELRWFAQLYERL
jgi:hypothetical protein